ncbi:MAG TPA: Smr/MutS family protein [Clostridia bacterium]|nr:Smr/MutS family protein [Clostridia bacterium]
MIFKTINIEAGLPTVEIGTKKLYLEIITAKKQGVKVLKVIHGYGSSGVGGRLKKGILEYLAVKKKEGFVKDYIPGDSWNIFNGAARDIIARFGELRNDRDLVSCNPGISIVIL